MIKSKKQPYLLLRNNHYYFRISIPKDYRLILQRNEYKRALGTQDYKTARKLCWRMGDAAFSFFEEIKKLKPVLNDDEVRKIVKNHFEKRLIDAVEDYITHTDMARNDPKSGFRPETLQYMRKVSAEQLSHYNILKQEHRFDNEQVEIAQELIENWKKINHGQPPF